MKRAIVWVAILTTGMGMAPRTASGAPQVQKNAPVGNATNEAVASQGKQAQYLDYLRKSLTQQTQWPVYEHNNEKLWVSVRQAATNFVLKEWKNGKLQGSRPQQAFTVKCDRSTMTQSDIDNGRMIVFVGVALQRPGKFALLRIHQWTADRK